MHMMRVAGYARSLQPLKRRTKQRHSLGSYAIDVKVEDRTLQSAK